MLDCQILLQPASIITTVECRVLDWCDVVNTVVCPSLSSHLSPPTLSCLGNSPESSDKLEVTPANINVVYLIQMAFDLFISCIAWGQPLVK